MPFDGMGGLNFEHLLIRPGRAVDLSRLRPGDTSSFRGGKRAAEALLPGLREELDRLQELLYADGRHALLVILQGMDTSGKDSTIRHVFEGVNPQGVRVASFKVPTPEEEAHDFLWRVHQKTPAKGEIAIFNRSHYEDILAARVDRLVPHRVWSKRFAAINGFERELVDEGVTILKFFLHISKAEQRLRLRERSQDPTKQWKLTASDLKERTHWARYMNAYESMLSRTSTGWSPWFVVPANHRWFRDLVISSVLVGTLRGLHLRYPAATVDLASLRID